MTLKLLVEIDGLKKVIGRRYTYTNQYFTHHNEYAETKIKNTIPFLITQKIPELYT